MQQLFIARDNFLLTRLFAMVYGRLSVVANSDQAIRERVIALLDQLQISDAQFARDMGKTKAWANRWLRRPNGSAPVKTVDRVAEKYGIAIISVAPVVNTTIGPSGLTADVTGAGLHSATSSNTAGGSTDGRSSDVLERIARVQARYDTLRATVAGSVHTFRALLDRQDAEVAREESATIASDQRHDRQLSRRRRKRG